MSTPATPNTSFISRYGLILVKIVLYLILDVCVLSLGFYTATQVSEDAVDINLAGRQRMLSQRMAKSLLQIQVGQERQTSIEEPLAELNLTFDLFDNTLRAFDTGGFTKSATGEQVTLQPVSSPEGRAAIAEALTIWKVYQDKLRPVIFAKNSVDQQSLEEALAYAKANNLKMLKLMNDLTVALEVEANNRATFLRWVQFIALILVLGLFAYIVYDFIVKIRTSDDQIERQNEDLQIAFDELQRSSNGLTRARYETDSLLKSARQGLLLVNSEFEIQEQHSEAALTMLRRDTLQGENLLGILQRILTDKDYQTSKDYLAMMFNPKKRERTLEKVNPLSEIEIHFQEKNAQFTSHTFEFAFRRVIVDDIIESVFVSFRDITAQVDLSRSLKKSEELKERQFGLLIDLLNVPSQDFLDFLDQSQDRITKCNQQLTPEEFATSSTRTPEDQNQRLRGHLDLIFRETHAIKGHAGSLGLQAFANMAHDIEDTITRLQRRPKLSGEDFLVLVSSLSDFKGLLDEGRQLGARISDSDISKSSASSKEKTHEIASFTHLQHIINQCVKDTKKPARLMLDMHWNIDVKPEVANDCSAILTQLIRNSFSHGFEEKAERENIEKSSTGTIYIQFIEFSEEMFQIVYLDDGKGLDSEAIRRKCLANGDATAAELDGPALWNKILDSGFSTNDNVDSYSGRGIGMDIIREIVEDKLKGSIEIHSEEGAYSKFVFNIPVTSLTEKELATTA